MVYTKVNGTCDKFWGEAGGIITLSMFVKFNGTFWM